MRAARCQSVSWMKSCCLFLSFGGGSVFALCFGLFRPFGACVLCVFSFVCLSVFVLSVLSIVVVGNRSKSAALSVAVLLFSSPEIPLVLVTRDSFAINGE